ncbi:MAG: transcription elongation factor GreA [Anaerolineae bacterium]|nr:transcription elongation factor GreA [Anaerolineae bacterium]MDK1081215.1 transcription elongation factor GreA [Anaerolineae bacterium]MDK1118356.1 transcription elongation factor GreA [Anaerolineae bacterium]
MTTPFLTKEGFDKLEEELDHLRKIKRQEVADRLHEAIDGGELIENAEYEAAKNEQAFVEGRIQELEMLLATAQVIKNKKKVDSVQVGSTVTIKKAGADEESYTIVGAAEADPGKGKISNESPMGKAILDQRAGDDVQIETPDGDYTVRIVKIG